MTTQCMRYTGPRKLWSDTWLRMLHTSKKKKEPEQLRVCRRTNISRTHQIKTTYRCKKEPRHQQSCDSLLGRSRWSTTRSNKMCSSTRTSKKEKPPRTLEHTVHTTVNCAPSFRKPLNKKVRPVKLHHCQNTQHKTRNNDIERTCTTR